MLNHKPCGKYTHVMMSFRSNLFPRKLISLPEANLSNCNYRKKQLYFSRNMNEFVMNSIIPSLTVVLEGTIKPISDTHDE